MALAPVGNVADTDTAGTPRHHPLVVAQSPRSVVVAPSPRSAVVAPSPRSDESLLDAIRCALAPGDPVARLLAHWPSPPVRAVEVLPRRRAMSV